MPQWLTHEWNGLACINCQIFSPLRFYRGNAGGNGWEDMEVYGLSKQAWLSTFLALPNGIPSADTFRRVFERMNPQQFEHCFEQWITQLVQDLGIQVIAIDGKVAKGSYDRESGCQTLHPVSAWATGHRLVLAQAFFAGQVE